MKDATAVTKPISKVFSDFLEKAYGPYFGGLPVSGQGPLEPSPKSRDKDNACTPCVGPFEPWGNASDYQMLRCKSCLTVHFFESEEMKHVEMKHFRETEIGSSPRKPSAREAADIEALGEESEKFQDLTTFNFDSDEKVQILRQKEKPYLPQEFTSINSREKN